MKISELIQILGQFAPDAEIMIAAPSTTAGEIDDVELTVPRVYMSINGDCAICPPGIMAHYLENWRVFDIDIHNFSNERVYLLLNADNTK